MKLPDWEKEPIPLITIPDCDYILMIDENGQSSNFKNIEKKIKNKQKLDETERVLCLTGVIISAEEYINNLKSSFNNLKEKYWENGNWFNSKRRRHEKIHFHSVDFGNIKNRRNCMRLLSNKEMTNFVEDLSIEIKNLKFEIVSICIDNYKFINRYTNPFNQYHYSTSLLLERFGKFLNEKKKTGVIVFESRAHQDWKQLNNVKKILKCGNYYNSAYIFQNILGCFFNPKRPINTALKSYVGIELVDLVGHPIYKFFLSKVKGKKYSGRDWQMVEKKMSNYPRYQGYGLKHIP